MSDKPTTPKFVLSIVALLIATGSVVSAIEVGQRPNIILIVADDQGYADVSFRGSQIQTPHLDALAQSGAVLNRFYACPVCSPTRAGLMTGRYPIRFGMQRAVNRPFSEIGLPDLEQTLPELLALAGYKSLHMIGKWHLGNMLYKHLPPQQGFTSHYGPYTSGIDYFKHTRMGQHDFHRNNKTVFETGYATNLLSAEAVRLIRSHANDSDPFFLYLPHSGVHSPTQATLEDVARYVKRGMSKPQATYAAMVAAIDDGIGEIVKALNETGKRDNTLIIYISDNGGTARGSNHPLRGGKGSIYEGGIRVLALASWPGKIPERSQVDAICSYIDIVPTFCAVAGVQQKPDRPWDGRDVMPLWSGQEQSDPNRRFFSYFETYKAPGERLSLIEGDWKIIRRGKPILNSNTPTENAVVSLYDLAKDISESNDVAEQYPDRVAKMLSDLAAFRRLRPEGGVDPQPGPMPKDWKPPKNWEPIPAEQNAQRR